MIRNPLSVRVTCLTFALQRHRHDALIESNSFQLREPLAPVAAISVASIRVLVGPLWPLSLAPQNGPPRRTLPILPSALRPGLASSLLGLGYSNCTSCPVHVSAHEADCGTPPLPSCNAGIWHAADADTAPPNLVPNQETLYGHPHLLHNRLT
jgi:hypothetical protein